jgi:eukaryotic-like serine/threonine-protein kinase
MIDQLLAHYKIIAKLGAGGMGEVYSARDQKLERDVALKILPAGSLIDEAARKRFRKEALALSKLNHPNIATIYDFDTASGVDFIAMELVIGETLAEKAASGPLPEKEIVTLGSQIAGALEEAHEHGIVHHDLKPSNVMVTSKGRVKVLDFGLAKLVQAAPDMPSAETLSQTLGISGTLPYMSPEQLQGEQPDPRSDIFSLGILLYQISTGQLPFRETVSSRLTDAILHQVPVSPRAQNPRISPELERTILKCLEKQPEHRYQSAKEILADLSRLSIHGAASTPSVTPIKPRRSRILLSVAGAAVLLLAVLYFVNQRHGRVPFGHASSAPIHSIAVLPLENFSRDPDQDYFADGMTEALITDLSKISGLQVISRTSAMQYKGSKKLLPAIAKELQVDAVIEGSVEKAGDRVRITAQLIEAANDKHLWAESYDRDMRDVLTLQDEVARRIAGQVQVKLTPQEQKQLSAKSPTNPEAYQLYLQGRFYWNKGDESGLKKSIEFYQAALAKEPNYALAYAGLADSYSGFSDWYLPPRRVMPQAKAAALKALQLDNSLAATHAALCWIYTVYEWDWPGAERECNRAIELSPNSADAHDTYSNFLACIGRWEKAEAEIHLAEELDPLSFRYFADAAMIYYDWHRYDQAVLQAQKSLSLQPDYFIAHLYLGMIYAQTGPPSEAIAEAQKAVQLSDSPLTQGVLGYSYAAAGKKSEARKIAADLGGNLDKHFVCPFEIGTIYIRLGEKDESFRWLNRAYEERSICISGMKFDPRLDPIRSDPRYDNLVRQVNFPQ